MPSIMRTTEQKIRGSIRNVTRHIAAGCKEAVDALAIAIFPGIRFKNLEFGPPVQLKAQVTVEEMAPPVRIDPHNGHIYRYFTELPTNKSLGFEASRWSSRLDIVPYSPSIAKDLQKVHLADLKPGGRNDGVCIVVKITLTPKHLEAIYVLIEDEKGRWDLLHIFDFPYTKHPDDRVAQGQLLLIKEPYCYFGVDGFLALRADHATDITYIMYDHPLVPDKWKRSDVHGIAVLPKVLRWDGEVRMKWKKYHQAIDCLTFAMKLCDQVSVKRTGPKDMSLVCKDPIRKLRVGAYYYAGYYELCIEDADILMQKSFDEKAAWYKANCCFKMRQYDEAKNLILKVLRTNTKFKFSECTRLLLQLGAHSQHVKGQYNMGHILERCNEGKSDLMAGDYVSGIRVRKSSVHGYGLFATKDFKAGETILVCKAFASVGPNENRALILKDSRGKVVRTRYAHKLTPKIIEKMYCEPKSAPLISKIYSGKNPRPVLKDEDGMVLVDTFHINAIVEHNAIQYNILTPRIDNECAAVDSEFFSDAIYDRVNNNNTISKENASINDEQPMDNKPMRDNAGFWIPAAFMNHSCVPNTRRSVLSDMMFIVASVDIPKSTELFINYMDDDYGPFEDRRGYIKEKWDFECFCPRCLYELENPNYWEKRGRVQTAIEGLIYGQVTSHLPSQLSGIQTCLFLLESNILDSPYDIPNFEIAYALMAEEYLRRKVEPHLDNTNRDLRHLTYAVRMIRALGGEFEFDQTDVKIVRLGFVCKWLVEAYLLATVSTARFYGPVHWSLRIAAQKAYGILCAEALTFDEIVKTRIESWIGNLTIDELLPAETIREILAYRSLEKTKLVGLTDVTSQLSKEMSSMFDW